MSYPPGPNYPRPINSHLVWAILTTLFCCTPFGIVAIVKAARVDNLVRVGDYVGAQAAADGARNWSIWAAVTIPLVYLVIALIALATGAFESSSTN